MRKRIMFTTSNLYKMLLVSLASSALVACGSGSVDKGGVLLTCDVPLIPDAAGQSCVAPPPIDCPAPTVPDALNERCEVGFNPELPAPVYLAQANEAVLYYNRANIGVDNAGDTSSYDGYKLHLWNNASCDSYAESEITSWADGKGLTGVDPIYGAYYVIQLKEGYGDCGNFIIHEGDNKALGDGDLKMPLQQDDATFRGTNFTFHSKPDIYEFPVDSLGKQPLKISDISAHWIDANTFVWQINDDAVSSQLATVKLHHSASAGIQADENDKLNGTAIELMPVDLTAEQKAAAPLVADWPAYAGDWSAADAKAVLKNELVLAAYDTDGNTLAATYVQADKVLDAIYTSGDNDADEANLGVSYLNGEISVSVWAPTAQSVSLHVFDAAKNATASHAMTEDTATGIWRYTGSNSLDRAFYQFEVSVYHYQSHQIETLMVTDPHSVSLSTNGEYSQFVNLTDSDLMPAGWESQMVTPAGNYEDAVIYEGHIRDFSVMDESTSTANRGKYLAFTETNSLPVQHLQELADNGLNYFHMLPANDIASINEDADMQVNLTDTVGDLCALNADAPVCGEESNDTTLKAVLESYNPLTNDAAALINAMRGYDSFNWGYDPKHFNVPDGSYASNPDGVARILEMRSMIQSLHEMGLRVVLDVVYNHTNSAGLWDHSVFDKIVPGYYHSRDLVTGKVLQSTCCNDTALEHRMMDKFMVDSLKLWAEHYKMDGFRFDIMSQGSKAQMLAARDAVQAIDEDSHFYGEGWYKESRGFERADQTNMAGTEIATYNDRLRDAIRYGDFFDVSADDDSALIAQDKIKFGMAGTLSDYVLKSFKGTDTQGAAAGMYAKDPADIVNYISKHDNETLWDMLQFHLPHAFDVDQRVRVQNVSHAIVLMSQGIPFVQLGGDFLRSKSLDANTYDAGDWYNYVDFTMYSNNYNVGLPLEKRGRDDETLQYHAANFASQPDSSQMMFASEVFNEFLNIRQSSPLFRLTSAQDVIDRIGFHNIGKRQTQNLIVMSIDDGTGLADLDPANDAIVVVVNGSDVQQSHTVATAVGFELHQTQVNSVDAMAASASFSDDGVNGTFTVPAQTVAVFVKPQGENQGMGLSAYATSGAPDVVPFGDTEIFVRGDMNGWGTTNPLTYVGGGVYETTITLAAGSYSFKVANASWDVVNLGSPSDTAVLVATDKTLVPGSNDNLSISITDETSYIFSVDASDTANPVLNVRYEAPYYGTAIYLRGDMNGWGTTDELTYLGDGKYSVSVNISEAKTYGFKVASADWSTVNIGAPSDDNDVLTGEEQLMEVGSNTNFSMDLSVGEYTFIFNAKNADELILSVYSAEFFGSTTVYVRGGMNSWGEVDALTYQGGGVYSVELALNAQTYELKVASGDWSTFNLGGDEATLNVQLDEPSNLVPSSQSNLSLTLSEAGTYVFTVLGPNPEAATVTVTKK